ncbi:MAG: FHA domain-containing protein [Planctomycetota bacterium]|nr:MAG: FHA domain-containing protein [Planctomycetota bacterium]
MRFHAAMVSATGIRRTLRAGRRRFAGCGDHEQPAGVLCRCCGRGKWREADVAFLRFVRGGPSEGIVALEKPQVVLGRHPSCDVVLDYAEISRHHARIFENHGSYFIEDLRSRNGTQVNTRPVRDVTPLRHGDRVQLCDVEFVFHEGSGEGMSAVQAEQDTRASGRTAGASPPAASGETLQPNSTTTVRSLGALDSTGDPGSAARPAAPARRGIERGTAGRRLGAVVAAADRASEASAERALVKLRALTRFSRNLTGHFGFAELLKSLTGGLFELFPQAQQVVYLEPSAGHPNEFEVRWIADRQGRPSPAPQVSREILQRVLQNGEALLSENVAGDARFDHTESVERMTACSVMCVPVVDHQENVIGVLQLTAPLLAGRFDHDDLDLFASVAAQFGLALQTLRLYEARLRERDLQRELELATQVQLGFLPRRPPRIPGYRFADFYEPAHGVGGDYFDYVPLRDDRWAVVVADVAGKGMPAALLMARICSAVRSHLHICGDPGEVLERLNADLVTSALGHRFVSCVIAVLDVRSHRIDLANAGHWPPLRRTPEGDVASVGTTESGLPLGISGEARYKVTRYPIAVDETWLLYTDGVTEAKGPDRAIYGMPRLVEYLRNGPSDVEALIQGLVADVDRFSEGSTRTDDMCIVGFQRTAGAQPAEKRDGD